MIRHLLEIPHDLEHSTVNASLSTLHLRPSRYSCIFAAFCSILFTVVGCLGNWLTIVALARCRRLQGANTAFVISLAAADLLFCVVCLPLTATRYVHEGWILGNGLCSLFPFFFYGNVAASLMSMTAITFNRFFLINCNSFYATLYSRLNVWLMVLFCWSFSYLIMLPTLLGRWGRFGYDEASFSCTILRGDDGRSPKKFLFALGFLLPTVTIIACYSCIFYRVRSSAVKVRSHEDPSSSKRFSRILPRRKEELKVTFTMLACFCTFQVCFLPLMVVNVFEEDIKYPIVHILASVLAWMSACTNPFIYVLLNRHYRAAYFQLLGSWRLLGTCPSQEACSVSSRTSNVQTIYREENRDSVSRDIAV